MLVNTLVDGMDMKTSYINLLSPLTSFLLHPHLHPSRHIRSHGYISAPLFSQGAGGDLRANRMADLLHVRPR
jgi:hypothetical protein